MTIERVDEIETRQTRAGADTMIETPTAQEETLETKARRQVVGEEGTMIEIVTETTAAAVAASTEIEIVTRMRNQTKDAAINITLRTLYLLKKGKDDLVARGKWA